MHVICYLVAVVLVVYSLDRMFMIVFMLVLGGQGSILVTFLNLASGWLHVLTGVEISHAVVSNLELIIFGGLIIFFLIAEPAGLARLWQITKEKLRLWPFPH